MVLAIIGVILISSVRAQDASTPLGTPVRTDDGLVFPAAVVTGRAYGADPSGRADSSPAVQAAINAVGKSEGGVVFMPAGVYRMMSPVQVAAKVTLMGEWRRPEPGKPFAGTLLLAYPGRDEPDGKPFLETAPHCQGQVMNLAVYYPEQRMDDIRPYPWTIRGSVSHIRNITLFNSFRGIDMDPMSGSEVSGIYGCVLDQGIRLRHAGELCWCTKVHFSPRYWTDMKLPGAIAVPDHDTAANTALTDHVRRHLTGLQIGRVDGLSVYGVDCTEARKTVWIHVGADERVGPSRDSRNYGFGGILAKVCGERVASGWDAWYFGSHYADLDAVPEARGKSYEFASTPAPAKLDPDSVYNAREARFGAIGDGEADDSDALAKALAAAGEAGGGTVFLPPGTYRLTRPLTVPRGVEMRGSMASAQIRCWFQTCALLIDHGQASGDPDATPAALTLNAGAGLRGLLITYPDLLDEMKQLNEGTLDTVDPRPWCIRGNGPGVYVVDVTFRAVSHAIDLAAHRCDRHLVRGVWGTVVHRGVRVGGGSRDGCLERIAFDIGPSGVEAEPAVNQYLQDHAEPFLFGDCDGERTFGLATFHPRVQVRLVDENGNGCRNAEFWSSIFDVARDAGIDVEHAGEVDFLGLFLTGKGGGKLNWIEMSDQARGPVRVYAPLIQQPFQNHALPFADGRVRLFGEASLCQAGGVTAEAGANEPGTGPGQVLDRDPATGWQAPAGATLTVDLGRPCTLRRWRVDLAGLAADREQNAAGGHIRAGLNRNAMQTVATFTGNTFAWLDRPFDPAPVFARYVELLITEGSQPGGDGKIRVQGFDLYGKPCPGKPAGIRAGVASHGGVPMAVLDGSAHNGMLRASFNATEETKLFAEAGVDLFSFVNTASQGFWERAAWKAPGSFDFSHFDSEVRQFLAKAPDARLLPRLELSAPAWWREAYLDDLVQVCAPDGKTEPLLLPRGDNHVLKQNPNIVPRTVPSWASRRWREDTAEAIRRLIAHAQQSDYAERIAGWHICSGESHEWFFWDNVIDVSPANLAAYRQWLRDKYGHDKVLQNAWGNPEASFADALPPTEAERARNPNGGSLRDPAAERRVLDFLDYTHDMTASAVEVLCRAAREATAGTKLVGAFYGYTFGLRGEPRQQCAGHHALERILHSPNIDFLASPHLYWHYRRLGSGTPSIMAPLDSVRLHGKLWYSETDIPTSLTGTDPDTFQSDPAKIAEDVLQQRRQCSWVLARGLGHWWFDVGGIRYDHPDIRAVIKQAVGAAEFAKTLDRSPVDEVAFVVDEGSVKYLNVGDPLGEDLLTGQLPALCRMGAPAGHYALHDLARIMDRKLFLFGGVLAPSREARRAIEALKGNGRVLVFTYAPGLYRDGEWDERGMEALTGIPIERAKPPERFEAVLKSSLKEFSELNGIRFGAARKVDPVFLPVEGDGLEVLARLDDGRSVVVMKRFQDWTAVFSAVPMLPDTLLNRLAKLAGVHLYTEPGVALWASRDALAISVDDARTVKLRLPAECRVTEVWTSRQFGQTREIELAVPKHDSRLFYFGEGSR